MIASVAAFDLSLIQLLFAARDQTFVSFFALATELGGGIVVIGIALVSIVYFLRKKNTGLAAGLLVALGGAMTTTIVLKPLVARARPPEFMHAIMETGYSFPSRHAVASMALYGFLAYAIYHLLSSEGWKNIGIGIMALIIVLVGFSRVYLGVHYPSDIIGGYCLGYFFVWVGILVQRKLDGFLSLPKSS